jgi:hypothetical protein
LVLEEEVAEWVLIITKEAEMVGMVVGQVLVAERRDQLH